jgi:hypothetical protein
VDNLPSNSYVSKKAQETPPVDDNKDDKKIEQVVTGKVVRRKKPLSKRFAELFIGGDAQSVGQYLVMDVLIPAFKETIMNVITEGIERTLYGDNRRPRRTHTSGRGNGYVSYNRYSSPDPRSREEPRRPIDRKRSFEFEEIVLESKDEAEEVIDNLFAVCEKYGQATVADLYDMAGITTNYTHNQWGWTDLRGAGATRVRGGYLIDVPKPDALN